MTDAPEGYFIDWDGKTRPVDQPGKGLRCEVDKTKLRERVEREYRAMETLLD